MIAYNSFSVNAESQSTPSLRQPGACLYAAAMALSCRISPTRAASPSTARTRRQSAADVEGGEGGRVAGGEGFSRGFVDFVELVLGLG